ncbi:MAG: alanine racemase [Gammaproteobacteria bacterium]
MTRPARVVIDVTALSHNFSRIRKLVPKQKVMAIVKAEAYGHGLVRVARVLDSADAFGVASLDEAMKLRDAGITRPIVLLEGPYMADEIPEIQRLGLDIVVHHETQIAMLEKANTDKPIPIWIKIDTGMHRLGFAPGQFAAVWQRLQGCATVNHPIRLMTHLAAASEADNPLTGVQLSCFRDICANIPSETSIANSAAILQWPESHADWVRPGLMLYGVSPFADHIGENHGLRPVMTLQSELISIQHLGAGESVGYGASWCCPEDMPVGIVAAGYGDGFPRHAKSGTPVLVNGKRVDLVGRASMDMLTVDLRNQADAKVGDPVVLWGEGLPIEMVAQGADTIPYELLCGVHKRLECVERG